ncbi:cephalosporin hydroxylase family protein [Nitrosopumilus sp.]|uniref:cephalosporin hydroxylase family protein n=1 Tax=Nitrosopumilus sp. TaxID=2024843 RepID=UPI002621E254|nr:CmcI family methyltransferase [Nitrosopumilus sp.]
MTNKDFEKRNQKKIKSMVDDKEIEKISRKWFNRVFSYEYSYHFSWLGRPIIQFPQDMIAIQEIIWKTKPDIIIETGIAHGGSLIFSASILELIGKGKVIGIDIDIRKHNRKEIEKHPLKKRITMLEGSSLDGEILKQVKKLVKNKKKIVVFLDSYHTHEHVLRELEMYSPLVKNGSYVVVFDTMVEFMPKNSFPNRPWDKGNNPHTAVMDFLKKNKRFKIDKEIENKLLITSCPDGFLKCIKS